MWFLLINNSEMLCDVCSVNLQGSCGAPWKLQVQEKVLHVLTGDQYSDLFCGEVIYENY